ncbi:lipid-A-disaccharide synthase [Flavitalea antarctica]
MRYYIIAGEASGDLHGSNLVREMKNLEGGTEFRGWGGDLMQTAGVDIIKHFRDLAFMGFIEVVKNLPTILKNLSFCKQDILRYKPDVLILIDYPGFNLRIAEWAKEQKIRIVYYISPQVWAWKESRVKKIRRHVDKMLVILPFEKQFYQKWNYKVEYVGHPLVGVIEEYKKTGNKSRLCDKPIIALLPGSRKQEILVKLPVMLAMANQFPAYQFIVAQAPGQEDEFYRQLLKNYSNVSGVTNETYRLLSQASAALVTSGTATLETALFGVPEVVCYKGSKISYEIAKRLIKIKYISLVNLIMDKEVVKELIQDEMNESQLETELTKLLEDPAKKDQLRQDYAALKQLLSEGGDASRNAAELILAFSKESHT